MRTVPDWRLILCLALGMFVMFALAPMIELLVFGRELSGTLVAGIKGGFGAIIGLAANAVLFRSPKTGGKR